MTIQEFFDGYGEALAQRDIAAIARHWATPSIVLGPEGSLAVSTKSEVEAFFRQAIDQYQGVAAARASLDTITELLPGLIACEVRWDHLDGDGQVIGGETGYYVVRLSEGGGGIEVYSPRG